MISHLIARFERRDGISSLIASEVKVMFFGAIRAKKIQHALHRILGKVSQQHFNSLEVTGIVAKRFLGLPYAIVSAHSRHIQRGCYLEGAELRRSSQRDVADSRDRKSTRLNSSHLGISYAV